MCQLNLSRSSFTLDSKIPFRENIAAMKNETVLQLLEDAAERLDIKLSYEDLRKGEVSTPGGLFLLRGEKRIIIHRGLPPADRVEVLAEILSGVDSTGVHLPPEVRERLEKARLKLVPEAARA